MTVAIGDTISAEASVLRPPVASPRRVYFPGLNALRFFAAFAVVLNHVEQFDIIYGYRPVLRLTRFVPTGSDCVTLFFVLSGFLITYLLFEEQRRTGTVRVVRFYARRALRIWPLYYLITAVGFFLLPRLLSTAWVVAPPAPYFDRTLTMFLVFLPNVALVNLPMVLGASHLWSIGVEEQFYLAWPLIVRLARRWVVAVLVTVIVVKFAITWGYVAVWLRAPNPSADTVQWYWILRGLRFECMAVGGLGAWILFVRRRVALAVIFHPLTQLIAWALLVVICVWLNHSAGPLWLARFAGYADLPISVVFAVLIMNVAANPRAWPKLDLAPLNYLGQISYGIYMYHPAVIILCMAGMKHFHVFERHAGWHDVFVHSAAVVTTILVSAISYAWFEGPFLRLKHRAAVVASTDAPERNVLSSDPGATTIGACENRSR